MNLVVKLFKHSRIYDFTSVSTSVRSIKSSTIFLKKSFSRPPARFSKMKQNADDNNVNEETSDASADPLDEEYNKILDRTFRISSMGHQVLVIQPYIKWGVDKKRNTNPELQMAESCTLIKTLENWQVVDKVTVPLMSLDKTALFGKGNLEKLQDNVLNNSEISAVFVSVDILKGVQRETLEKTFRVPVYDRYSIVIQIFREHAVSREAKLQVKLAELPYLRGRLKYIQIDQHVKGRGGETYTEFQRNILKEQEKKIRTEMETLQSHRALLRKKRQKNQIPTVAVVGYTNCGKTSLIKALTQEEAIVPKNVLFATLDVTTHAGFLPSGLKCLFVDTIGFISDIPTTLLESFKATLEDALLADVIVHVKDISHPDNLAQAEQVHEVLHQLDLNDALIDNIITVGNKIDLVGSVDVSKWPGTILTSAVKSSGLDELKAAIEDGILKVGGRQKMRMRVRTGGEEYQWLRREATIYNILVDPNNEEYCILHVIVTPPVLAKFNHQFITSHRNKT